MYLDPAKKKEIFGQYGKSNTDTGSPEAQIALFSYRISHLTEHLKVNRKDYSTERALTTLVGKRRALLNYLKDRDIERYRAIVKALGLRKKFTKLKELRRRPFSWCGAFLCTYIRTRFRHLFLHEGDALCVERRCFPPCYIYNAARNNIVSYKNNS